MKVDDDNSDGYVPKEESEFIVTDDMYDYIGKKYDKPKPKWYNHFKHTFLIMLIVAVTMIPFIFCPTITDTPVNYFILDNVTLNISNPSPHLVALNSTHAIDTSNGVDVNVYKNISLADWINQHKYSQYPLQNYGSINGYNNYHYTKTVDYGQGFYSETDIVFDLNIYYNPTTKTLVSVVTKDYPGMDYLMNVK